MPSEGKAPFIPAWLDDSGLSQAEFRLYCHLCRRADRNGIAWPAVDGKRDDGKPSETSVIAVCGMARRTAWKTIQSLIDKGLVEKLGKRKFQSSNSYRVLFQTGAIEAPVESPIVSFEAPVASSPTGAIEAPPTGANGTLQPAQSRPREGSPMKVPQRRVSNKEVSPEGIQFADWFKSTLPESVSLKANWRESFAKIHDDLVRIDRRSPEEIRNVCQWARTDSFWKSNFMSPSKLRDRNPGGIQYFDVFAEKMKQPVTNGSGPQSAIAHREAKAAREYPEPPFIKLRRL